ncbi:hypothetical protein M2266_004662 [Streptomyces sp. SPB162]|nr:hypothetical protein [Streptomyces sp. SPB162]
MGAGVLSASKRYDSSPAAGGFGVRGPAGTVGIPLTSVSPDTRPPGEPGAAGAPGAAWPAPGSRAAPVTGPAVGPAGPCGEWPAGGW